MLETKEHCVRDKNKSKRPILREVFSLSLDDDTKYKEKAESLVIVSRIRERDKKSAEYYVGDY